MLCEEDKRICNSALDVVGDYTFFRAMMELKVGAIRLKKSYGLSSVSAPKKQNRTDEEKDFEVPIISRYGA